MSQLDISISFVQLFELVLCFYFFVHYIITIIRYSWYNYKLHVFICRVHTTQNCKGTGVVLLQQLLEG